MEAILNNITQNSPTVKRISFKTCTKCGGKMGLSSDEFGSFWDCISCGKTVDIISEPLKYRDCGIKQGG